MRFLVIGQGGREHAIVRALKYSPSVADVHAAPGSAGISQDAVCHDLDLSNDDQLRSFLQRHVFDCVVIGPEAHLVDGLSDRIRALGVDVVGPSQASARLEGSKVFAKEFMARAGIPTAAFEVVDDVASAMEAAARFTPPYVLKADGLAAGKGVYICPTLEELQRAARGLFEDRVLGPAGSRAVLEQYQTGFEVSYLLLTNGERAEALPLAQDHKRLRDGNEGPNTGGMGVIAPMVLPEILRRKIDEQVVVPCLREIHGSGLLYRGVLFIGLMITPSGPSVLEFNVRLGDPEAQVILPLLDGDWGYVFGRLARGELVPLQWRNLCQACVVMAAPGYPDRPEKGVPIEGDLGFHGNSSYFLHAGTAKSPGGQWVTSGGRVLNAVGMGSDLKEAVAAAYAQAGHVKWRGMQMRVDIGKSSIR